jgi:hypothetical protein
MPTTYTCETCGREMTEPELFSIQGHNYCQQCFDARYAFCQRCGHICNVGDVRQVERMMVCPECYTQMFAPCGGCGTMTIRRQLHQMDGRLFCESCYQRRREMAEINQPIHQYNYKPRPKFQPMVLEGEHYYGVELEVTNGGCRDSNATRVLDLVGRENAYVKTDGSIGDGFEVVTHPMTLDYHMNTFKWGEMMKLLSDLGYASHQSELCGLHIHTNRNAFTEQGIKSVVYFYEKFYSQMLQFSRRRAEQAHRWARPYGAGLNDVNNLYHHARYAGAKYYAVNVMPRETIEFRIFKGTLVRTDLIAALQMTHEMCTLFAQGMPDTQLKAYTWEEFMGRIKGKYSELDTYLKQRKLMEI